MAKAIDEAIRIIVGQGTADPYNFGCMGPCRSE